MSPIEEDAAKDMSAIERHCKWVARPVAGDGKVTIGQRCRFPPPHTAYCILWIMHISYCGYRILGIVDIGYCILWVSYIGYYGYWILYIVDIVDIVPSNTLHPTPRIALFVRPFVRS